MRERRESATHPLEVARWGCARVSQPLPLQPCFQKRSSLKGLSSCVGAQTCKTDQCHLEMGAKSASGTLARSAHANCAGTFRRGSCVHYFHSLVFCAPFPPRSHSLFLHLPSPLSPFHSTPRSSSVQTSLQFSELHSLKLL